MAQDNIRVLSRDAGGANAAVVDGDDDASVQHPYVSAPAPAAALCAVQMGSTAAGQRCRKLLDQQAHCLTGSTDTITVVKLADVLGAPRGCLYEGSMRPPGLS